MFSSLEALDAEDNLNATPVKRQGAFQPNAKPRARKGGTGPTRTPSTAPASKAKILVPSASNALDQSDRCDRKQKDGPNLQEEAQTGVEGNLECQSVGVAPQVSNKVGIETRPTHNSGLADPSFINCADLTAEPERNPAIEHQATATVHEPVALAEASGNLINAFVEIQESVALPSPVLLEQDAIGCLSTLSQADGLESLTGVSGVPSAFDELLASYAFVPVEPPLEHVTAVGACFEQLEDGMVELPSPAVLDTSRATSKKKRQHKDKHDNLLAVVDQGGLVLAEDASLVDQGMTSNSKLKPVKKKKKKDNHSDTNTQSERVSVEATLNPQKKTKKAKATSLSSSNLAVDASVAEEPLLEGVVQRVSESAKKKKRGRKQAQEGRDDGNDCPDTISEASSKKNKKATLAGSILASTSRSAAEVAVEVSGAKESVQEAVKTSAMKQEAQSCIEEQQEGGGDHACLTVSKRKRRKPARFLDGADDDDENMIITARNKGRLELAKDNRTQESQVERQQDFAESDLLSEIFPSLPKKISKLKDSKFSSFNATADAAAIQPLTEARRKASKPDKAATPNAEEKQKKKFKKFVPRRKRVERRAMNPADPDLDPKKMTMKDIIRVAEAKDRMLKKDNAKKAKIGNLATAIEPEGEPESHENTCMAPQVQIIDGQIVINEESLVINAHPKDDIRTYKRVEETHAKLNYHSYVKRTRAQTWRPEETELFYQALREFGTNFSMMQHLFPGRTRKQVLLKFKKEERCSPLRISEAMRVKPCDTSHFLEVMSSLNLLPSEIPDDLESGEASVPAEPTGPSSDKQEVDDKFRSLGDERRVAGGADCAPLKEDESSVYSLNQETLDKSSSSPGNIEASNSGKESDGNQELIVAEDQTTALNEMVKACESPRSAPSPPRRKKSLFSYQTTAAKS